MDMNEHIRNVSVLLEKSTRDAGWADDNDVPTQRRIMFAATSIAKSILVLAVVVTAAYMKDDR